MTSTLSERAYQEPRAWSRPTWAALLTLLTAAVLLIHGYHPLAEDGGLYVAGIEYTLDPTLFPYATAFVTEHLRFSVFAPCVAAIVRGTHLSLAWTLFLLYLTSTALTLAGGRAILRRCGFSQAAQLAGIGLLAVWWTLPIAATSLLLMDPYLTARSLTLPLGLFAAAFALDDWRSTRPWLTCALCLVLSVALHPLMAAYTTALVIGLRIARLRHPAKAWAALTLLALVIAAIIHAYGTPSTGALLAAERSRYYWFLAEWHGYELLGLAGPLLVFVLLQRIQSNLPRTRIAQAVIVLGCMATLVAVLFCRESDPLHLVARLQPLRIFLPIYALLALLLGATLTERLLAHRRTTFAIIPAAVLLLAAVGMHAVQRDTFPASIHVELPGRTNPNPWVRAFLWARENTPPNAVFALDAHYINRRGEDAQTFRAIALRSALPDFSKDGGEAAITPALAPAWQRATAAQIDLSSLTDAERDARLRPLGADWMVLPATATTAHPCPYTNDTVKVCRWITPLRPGPNAPELAALGHAAPGHAAPTAPPRSAATPGPLPEPNASGSPASALQQIDHPLPPRPTQPKSDSNRADPYTATLKHPIVSP